MHTAASPNVTESCPQCAQQSALPSAAAASTSSCRCKSWRTTLTHLALASRIALRASNLVSANMTWLASHQLPGPCKSSNTRVATNYGAQRPPHAPRRAPIAQDVHYLDESGFHDITVRLAGRSAGSPPRESPAVSQPGVPSWRRDRVEEGGGDGGRAARGVMQCYLGRCLGVQD